MPLMRVVSLLPSATETLCAIGGQRLLVGRSHECDDPPGIIDLPALTAQRTQGETSGQIDRQVRAVLADHAGSLYTLDADRLIALQPDVILVQDLCDVCSIDLNTVRVIAQRMAVPPRIVNLNPRSIEDVFEDVLRVGEAVGLEKEATRAVIELRGRYWSAIDFVNAFLDGPEIAFIEWIDPIFAGGHWTPQLIEAAGGRHSLNAAGSKSRRIAPDELLGARPERIVICPCGFDLPRTRRELPGLVDQSWWRQLPAVRDGNVALVDGSRMFNRPGPRLVEAFRWLVGWINGRPEVIPAGFPVEYLRRTGG